MDFEEEIAYGQLLFIDILTCILSVQVISICDAWGKRLIALETKTSAKSI